MHLTIGSSVGPYRVLSALGAGGMGEVYRARDEKLGRDIAVKVLSADLAKNADHLRRFEQEAHAASALNHPNIIAIYDIGRTPEGIAYIAMELVDGDDIRNIAGGTPLPLKQVLRISGKIADGLAAAHERGIVHRDLKPQNVMISRDGFVKILDFGLAKLAVPFTESDSTMPHTTPGALFGTIGYMSPEQAAGKPADFRSDQFALGVMIYEMVTGSVPFAEASAAETLAAIIRKEPRPIDDPTVPADLVHIIDRCLAKDPRDRYASTRDLARDLRELRDRSSQSSQPGHRTGPALAPRRRLAMYGASALVVAIAVVAALVLYGPWRPAKVQQGSGSIAIVPFRDLSQTPEGQIFADGLADMIGSRLIQSRKVRVMPPSRGDNPDDARNVARQKGAAFGLSGAVQRVGSTVHVSFALIDAATGEQVAGENLEAAASDLFGLQERAVELILGAMRVQHDSVARPSSPGLSTAADQNAYVEALGLLQRVRDENSIDQAVKILEGLLRNARDSAAVNAQLARALLYKAQLSRRPGLLEQATVYAERAVEIDDADSESHVRLGQLRWAVGRYQDAANEYRRALVLRPENPDAVLGLATTAEALGHAAEAEQMYRKAITLRPGHGNTYNVYGNFLYNNGRYREAADSFLRFTNLEPTARGFSNLSSTYQALGEYDEALRAAEKSIALGPSSDAYVNLGAINYLMGRYPEARAALEEGVALAPSSPYAWLALGDALRWSPGMRDKSAAAYEKAVSTAAEAIAINPRDAVSYAQSASALAKLGRPAEAEKAIKKALNVDPTNPSILYCAAVVALLRGNPDIATTWLQRAAGAGYPLADLQHDPEFRVLKDDPAFRRALNQK